MIRNDHLAKSIKRPNRFDKSSKALKTIATNRSHLRQIKVKNIR